MTHALTALPPETLDGHVGILATSGGGKTYGAKTAVEDLLEDGRRVCVIDPTGVWWGLRAGPDGKAGGYPVAIIGGDHADVPLAEGSGAALARAVADGDFSAIIDVSRLTVGARTRLFTDFAEELARANRRALHLVIDEAHLFIPQGRVNDPQSGKMVSAANHLVSGGRALGLRLILVSQRPAKVHKDSLTQVATLVPMWMTAPQDTAAVKAWVADVADPAQGRELISSLPSLQVGHGWVWSPRAAVFSRIAFRRLRTFDSSRAPALDEDAPTARLSALPIEELRAALAAEEPTAAESPPTKRASKGELQAAEDRGYKRGLDEGARAGQTHGVKLGLLQVREALNELEKAAGGGLPAWNEAGAVPDTAPAAPRSTRLKPPPRAERPVASDGEKLGASAAPAAPRSTRLKPPPRAERPVASDGEKLGASAMKLLQVLRAPNMPDGARTWSEVAVLAVLAPSGGSFNAARRQLLDSGQVRDDADRGLVLAGAPVAAPDLDGAAIVEAWCAKLGGSARRILSSLYVAPATKAELARDLELAPKGGSWNAAWKKLRSNGLVEEVDGGRWRMTFALRLARGRLERTA